MGITIPNTFCTASPSSAGRIRAVRRLSANFITMFSQVKF